mgnify:CR=1 FL=1
MLSLQPLKGGLIVSCQAPADSPLHDRDIIAAFAETAVRRGAIAVRIDSPNHIEAVRSRLPDIPIIGLWKQTIADFDVYITPQFHHAEAVAKAGADIVAIDATLRKRPQGETVADLVARIHGELGKRVMADVDTLEAGVAAAKAGADIVATTLYGYTNATQTQLPPGFNLLAQLVATLDMPIVCEGGISRPELAKQALELGAFAIVVGTAITGVDALTTAYCNVTLPNEVLP